MVKTVCTNMWGMIIASPGHWTATKKILFHYGREILRWCWDALKDVETIHTFSPCSIKFLHVPPIISLCANDNHGPSDTRPLTTTVSWSKNGWRPNPRRQLAPEPSKYQPLRGELPCHLPVRRQRAPRAKEYFKNSFCVIPYMEEISYNRSETQPLGHRLVMKGKDSWQPPNNSPAPLLRTGSVGHSGCIKSKLGSLPSPEVNLMSCSNLCGWREAIACINRSNRYRKWLRTASGMKKKWKKCRWKKINCPERQATEQVFPIRGGHQRIGHIVLKQKWHRKCRFSTEYIEFLENNEK